MHPHTTGALPPLALARRHTSIVHVELHVHAPVCTTYWPSYFICKPPVYLGCAHRVPVLQVDDSDGTESGLSCGVLAGCLFIIGPNFSQIRPESTRYSV